MKLREPVDPRLPWIRTLHDLDEARAVGCAGPRGTALRRAGELLGEDLREGPKVAAVRTLSLSTLIYPTTFAFNRAVPLPWPYVVMTHRCLLVQIEAEGETKNVLFNPTDYEASKATPFFAQLLEKMPSPELGQKLLSKQWGQVDTQLAELGLSAEDIDVVAFDHFHTQDLRPILGSAVPTIDGVRLRARFPNAYLLAPRAEWADWDQLHPLQQSWFIADGKEGVPEDRVILTDHDLSLGDGCLLLRTPGHTTGNQTLFVHGERGVFGCSENGTSADNWCPLESRIPGLRKMARDYGYEVILNSNTPELAAEQYNSMLLERSVVDRSETDPAYVQMFPSSEVTPSLLAPGIRPAMLFEERDSGTLRKPALRASRPAAVAAAE
jgi:hypothetical protein